MTQGRSRTAGQPGSAHGAERGADRGAGPGGAGRRPGGAGGWLGGVDGYQRARIAVAALLVVLVAVGLRGSLPSPALNGPYSRNELPVAAGLEAVVLGLLLATVLRTVRAPRDNSLATRLREVLRTVLGAAALAVPALYLVTRNFHSHHRPPRPPQPTGSELLARAASAGIVRGRAAARLTSVFYEARFSTRPLTDAHREVAEQALTELAASLAEPAGTGGAGRADGSPT